MISVLAHLMSSQRPPNYARLLKSFFPFCLLDWVIRTTSSSSFWLVRLHPLFCCWFPPVCFSFQLLYSPAPMGGVPWYRVCVPPLCFHVVLLWFHHVEAVPSALRFFFSRNFSTRGVNVTCSWAEVSPEVSAPHRSLSRVP